MTAGDREFQVAGAAQLKDRLLIGLQFVWTAHRETERPMTAVTECRSALICRLRLTYIPAGNIDPFLEFWA